MKNKMLIFSIILFFNLNTFSQRLYFEGLYMAVVDSTSLSKEKKYLKFYKNRDVVSATSIGTPQKVKNWLLIESEHVSKGKYKIKNEYISFYSKNKYGKVKYSGKIKANGSLELNSKSMINGHEALYLYKYIAPSELQKEEKVVNKSPVKIFSYEEVGIKPNFIGGEEKMLQFIRENLLYPQESINNKVEGGDVRFVVEKDGKCSNPEIIKGLDENCNLAVFKISDKMPLWSPGKDKGVRIRCYYVLPIKFTLPQ